MTEIKTYKPSTNSLSEGQVLAEPYPYDKARIIVAEMADSLVFQLTDKGLVTDGLTLDIGYDRENCDKGSYRGPVPLTTMEDPSPKAPTAARTLETLQTWEVRLSRRLWSCLTGSSTILLRYAGSRLPQTVW